VEQMQKGHPAELPPYSQTSQSLTYSVPGFLTSGILLNKWPELASYRKDVGDGDNETPWVLRESRCIYWNKS
jgi:hypothetical protein